MNAFQTVWGLSITKDLNIARAMFYEIQNKTDTYGGFYTKTKVDRFQTMNIIYHAYMFPPNSRFIDVDTRV